MPAASSTQRGSRIHDAHVMNWLLACLSRAEVVEQTVGVIQVIDPFVERMLQVVTLETPEQRDACHLKMTGGRHSKADALDFAGEIVSICEVGTCQEQHVRICRQNLTRAHQSDARRNRRTSEQWK
eukprot:scaffold12793_cov58-Phaeocystis_antarctica.AAC.2